VLWHHLIKEITKFVVIDQQLVGHQRKRLKQVLKDIRPELVRVACLEYVLKLLVGNVAVLFFVDAPNDVKNFFESVICGDDSDKLVHILDLLLLAISQDFDNQMALTI
jgi:ribosomal protein L10